MNKHFFSSNSASCTLCKGHLFKHSRIRIKKSLSMIVRSFSEKTSHSRRSYQRVMLLQNNFGHSKKSFSFDSDSTNIWKNVLRKNYMRQNLKKKQKMAWKNIAKFKMKKFTTLSFKWLLSDIVCSRWQLLHDCNIKM